MAKHKGTKELRGMDESELETRLTEAKQELFNLRFQLVTGQLDNSARISTVRKDVARINTLLREREIEAAEALAAAAGSAAATVATTEKTEETG